MVCQKERRTTELSSPAKRGLHPPRSVLESGELESPLVVCDCFRQFGRVQVQVDVNQVGEQPLGVPTVLFRILHLQIAALGTWEEQSVDN